MWVYDTIDSGTAFGFDNRKVSPDKETIAQST